MRDRVLETRMAARLDERAAMRRAGVSWRSPEPAALRSALEQRLGNVSGRSVEVARLERMAGGGTNEIHRVEFADGTPPCVLRLKIPGSGVVTDVLREFEAMRTAGQYLPVPRALDVVESSDVFGAPALLVSLEPGVQVSEDQPVRASGMGIRFPDRLRASLGDDFVRHLGRLHAAPTISAELSAFEMPAVGSSDGVERELAFWDRVWTEDRLEPHPTLLLTSAWLWEHAPRLDHVSLLHGDYRSGNFLFDAQVGRITSIIDWEMAAVGDRHRDLAYTMLEAFGDRDTDGRFRVAGLVGRDRFLTRYEEMSGLTVDRARLKYYLVFNMYWSTISMLGTGLRNARAGRTQLDVMYGVMAGQAVRSFQSLHALMDR